VPPRASPLAGSIRAIVLAGLAVAVWPGSALAQARQPVEPKDQIVLSGDVVVPKGHVVGEVVVFNGIATISGVVAGDVVVLHGAVVVAGQVGGDVVALDGPVKLDSTAQVNGDVLGGHDIVVKPGVQVGGSVREHASFTLARTVDVLGTLLPAVSVTVSLLPVLLLLLLFAPRGAERVAATAASAPLKAAGWGLIIGAAVPVVGIAAGLTVVGLPLGLVVLLGMGLVWIVGLACVTWVIGRLVIKPPRSRLGALFAGWGIGGVISLVPYLNGVWWVLGAAFGIGAVAVGTWRARRGDVSVSEPASRVRGGRHRAGRVAFEEVPSVPVADAPVGDD
jgi:cytoskeletal protein CcmA (bactofilin family)